MTLAEARKRVWERLAVTAINDIDLGDWMHGEGELSDADVRRLERACQEVADRCQRHADRIHGRKRALGRDGE